MSGTPTAVATQAARQVPMRFDIDTHGLVMARRERVAVAVTGARSLQELELPTGNSGVNELYMAAYLA